MLDRLVDLQNTDEKIVDFQREEDRLPKELESRERKLQDLESQRAEIEGELSQYKVQLAELDRELEAAKDSTRKFQTRLLIVKTQREYQAVQREGEAARKKRGDLEAQIKGIRDEMAGVEEQGRELDQVIEEEQASLEVQRKEMNGKLKTTAKERKDLEKTREVEASLVDPILLARYQKAFERYKGQGVVKVVGGVCYGCFMTVPPQLYNQVLAKGTVHNCPNCGRIIYVEEG